MNPLTKISQEGVLLFTKLCLLNGATLSGVLFTPYLEDNYC